MTTFKIEVPDDVVFALKNQETGGNRKAGRRTIHKMFGLSEQLSRIYSHIVHNGQAITIESSTIQGDRVKGTFSSKSAVVEIDSLTLYTKEQAVRLAKIDLEKWEIVNYTWNSWQTTMKIKTGGIEQPKKYTNYQVKLKFKPKISDHAELALRELIAQIPHYTPETKITIGDPQGPLMLVLCLFDQHFGMLAWNAETGQGDYDVKIAQHLYVEGVKQLLSKVSHRDISKIILPIGSDFFHINSPEGFTPKNHNPLDMDSRFGKIYGIGKLAVIRAVDYCIGVAPTDIIWVPGNHDPQTSFFLVDAMGERYRDCDQVTVDNGHTWRKYVRWGTNLIGITHGEEKLTRLPSLMPLEAPQHWAQTRCREWLIGHVHRKGEMHYMGLVDNNGVRIRIIPNLARIDQWHYAKGYVGTLRSAEAMLYHAENGYDGHHSTSVTLNDLKEAS
jgi:hypothetical protein